MAEQTPGRDIDDYLEKISQPDFDPLDKTTQLSLVYRSRNGDTSSLEDLFKSIQRMVFNEAMRKEDLGISMMDLVQGGNEGVARAFEKFDISTGNKFSSYAFNWIRSYIQVEVNGHFRNERARSKAREVAHRDVYVRPTEESALEPIRIEEILSLVQNEKQRIALSIKYGGGGVLQDREVAKILGISRARVQKLCAQGLVEIRAELQKVNDQEIYQ